MLIIHLKISIKFLYTFKHVSSILNIVNKLLKPHTITTEMNILRRSVKPNKTMKYSLIIIILLCYTSTFAQQWELIYHNDTDGNPISGDIETLKKAVRSGKEIRIGWGFKHPTTKKIRVEHVADASFLTIQSDSIVHAQIRPIVGQSPDFDNGTIALKENLEWVFIGGTNGKMDRMTRNVITGEIIGHKSSGYEFKWFIRK